MGLNACNPPSSYKRESFRVKFWFSLHFMSLLSSFNGKASWRVKFISLPPSLELAIQAHVLGDYSTHPWASFEPHQALILHARKPSQLSLFHSRKANFWFSLLLAQNCLLATPSKLCTLSSSCTSTHISSFVPKLHFQTSSSSSSFNGKLGLIFPKLAQNSHRSSLSYEKHFPFT